MPCASVTLPDGRRAIVCGTRAASQRCACGQPATLLCDWKLGASSSEAVGQHKNASSSEAVGQQRRTCDAPICAACATSPAPGKDICPAHAPALRAWQANRSTAS